MSTQNLWLKEFFLSRGWQIEDAALQRAGYSFDFVAESNLAAVFMKSVSPPSNLGEVANQLTGEVASIINALGRDAKAWEAYLVLVTSEGLMPTPEEKQRIE